MASITDLTVKKADTTTDILWTGMNGSAGDKLPAIWRSNTVGASVAFRPEFQMWAYTASSGTQRGVKTSLVYPILEVDGSITRVIGYCTQVSETKLLLKATDADAGEAVAQGINLLDHATLIAAIKSGFPPS